MSGEFSIGDLARRGGVSIETIRYYERVGLLPQPKRTPSGRRKYDERDHGTLTFIRKARGLGFPIEDTRALLKLRNAEDACADVKSIALHHLEKIRADMRRAIEVERMLSEALSRCAGSGSTSACSVLKVLESTA